MVHPGFKVSLSTLQRRYGEAGLALYRSSLQAFDLVEKIIREEPIDCGYRRSGHIELSERANHGAAFLDEAQLYRSLNEEGSRVILGEQLTQEVGSSLFKVGMLVNRSGCLHPARYYSGLLRLARTAGVSVHEQTAAVSLGRRGEDFEVLTDRGAIVTPDVLVATEGYTDGLVPQLSARVLPVGSYMIATEPLPAGTPQRLIPHGRMLFDSRNFLHYWRLSYDSRILFGGRASFSPTTITKARAWLYKSMLSIYPELDGVRITNAWAGRLGFTRDLLPHVGRLDGVTYATGYAGTGVALSTMFGVLAAKLILGEPLPEHLSRPFQRLPLGRRTAAFLPVAGLYYQAKDAFGLY
jgi:glycine/D-amino acid oxidase-like deaminating enzyme